MSTSPKIDMINLSIVRQSYANTVFTHQVQEVAACEAVKKNGGINAWNIIIVSIVLVLLLLQVYFQNILLFTYIGSGVTVAEIVFLVIQLTFNYDQKYTLHKNSALKYMQLRDKYRLLITDIMNNSISTQDQIIKRDSLQAEYQILCDLSPQTGEKERKEAQRILNKRGVIDGEQFTWSDEEIDFFLPELLKLAGLKQNQKGRD